MKKIFFSLALLFYMCIGAMAQTKVSFNGPIGIDWTFKRSFMHGKTLVVDFVVENNTSKDLMDFGVNRDGFDEQSNHYGITAYDDEGNIYAGDYSSNQIAVSVANQPNYNPVNLPIGNAVKVRMQIKGVDEFATKITTLMVPVMISGRMVMPGYVLRVTNIPIPRE